MPVPLGSQGQPDFSQPIELMMDCHRRIEHFLDVLRRIVDRYARRELDDEARGALETALAYFRQAAPRHTEDEEHSLFPRLRESDAPGARVALAELDELEADHQQAQAAHQRIDHLGFRWLDTGVLTENESAELRELLENLAAAYARHIQLEDERVFVLASQVLRREQLEEIGAEMRERRALNPGRARSRCAQRRRRTLTPSAHDRSEGPF